MFTGVVQAFCKHQRVEVGTLSLVDGPTVSYPDNCGSRTSPHASYPLKMVSLLDRNRTSNASQILAIP